MATPACITQAVVAYGDAGVGMHTWSVAQLAWATGIAGEHARATSDHAGAAFDGAPPLGVHVPPVAAGAATVVATAKGENMHVLVTVTVPPVWFWHVSSL